jgi:hypothetical protein
MGLAICCGQDFAVGQPAVVTALLETNRIEVGGSTRLHVYARVSDEQRTRALQIFSWNVDVLVSSNSVVRIDAGQLQRPRSDRDPQLSSTGTLDESGLRGVHDTFLSLTNAGMAQPVELFSVPIVALAPGQATLFLQPGTGSVQTGGDVIVALLDETGPPLVGADYSGAIARLAVLRPLESVTAGIAQTLLPGGRGRLITISFPVASENDYSVEYRSTLNSLWQSLPGAPHNAGFADDTNAAPQRFYRVRAVRR